MKFLVDAQLPRRLARWICRAGHDAIHTLDLPNRNGTPDDEVTALADAEGRVVISKDTDFVDSFLIYRRPAKLLFVSAGNITNDVLEQLMIHFFPDIVAAFQVNSFIELTATSLVVHE